MDRLDRHDGRIDMRQGRGDFLSSFNGEYDSAENQAHQDGCRFWKAESVAYHKAPCWKRESRIGSKQAAHMFAARTTDHAQKFTHHKYRLSEEFLLRHVCSYVHEHRQHFIGEPLT